MRISLNRTFWIVMTFIVSNCNLNAQSWVTWGNTIIGDSVYSFLGNSIDLSKDGKVMAIHAKGHWLSSHGKVCMYHREGSGWVQKGNPLYGDSIGDEFGYSMSLSDDGSILAVGAYRGVFGSGQTKVFKWTDSIWIQMGEDIVGDEGWSGYSVSLSGDGLTLAIGAPGFIKDRWNYGQVKVFEWRENKWQSKGEAIVGNIKSGMFGDKVALSHDGQTLAVGAYPSKEEEKGNFGQVFVFKWFGVYWIPKGSVLSGNYRDEAFGTDIGIDSIGDALVIGAPASFNSRDSLQYVLVYKWDGWDWSQLGQKIYGEFKGGGFGNTVAISSNGETIAVGVAYDKSQNFSRIYHLINGKWVEIGKGIPRNSTPGARDQNIDISGDGSYVVIGSPYANYNGLYSGAVKSYTLCTFTYAEIYTEDTCDFISPSGKRIANNGTFRDTLMNHKGCDSVITIHLNLKNKELIDLQPENKSVLIGDTVVFVTKTMEGNYQWQKDTGSGFENIADTMNYAGMDRDTLRVFAYQNSIESVRYRCIVRKGACADTSREVSITLLPSSEYFSQEWSERIMLFPNPANEKLNIKLEKTVDDPISIKVFNNMGSELLDFTSGQSSIDIATSGFSNGMYFIQVGLNNGKLYRLRFTIAR